MIHIAGLVGIGAAALLAFGGLQTYRVRGLQADVREVRAELVQAEVRLVAVGAQVEHQNAGVDRWRQQAAAAAQRAATARAEASRAAERMRDLEARLRSAPAPPAGASCDAQMAAIAGLLEEARR